MKSSLLFLILLALIIPLQARLTLDFASNFSYDTNVFQLSDYDMDRYEDGETTLSYIESTDDIIWDSSLKMQYQYRWNSLRIRPMVKAAASRYLSNQDKSNANLLGTLTLMHPKADLNLSYGYYPDNYLRKYKDKDGTELYEKFQYDKNMLKADAYLDVTRHESLYLYFKSEDYFYNRYFTEYDGTATTLGLGWRHSIPQFTLSGTYFYRDFESNAGTDFTDDSGDAAYESNIYDIGITWKNWKPMIASNPVNIRPSFSLSWEDRYYQGTDTFHNGRQDAMLNIGAGLLVPVHKNLDISLDLSHTVRNVSSNSLSVPRYKEYKESSISLGFSYTIDLLR